MGLGRHKPIKVQVQKKKFVNVKRKEQSSNSAANECEIRDTPAFESPDDLLDDPIADNEPISSQRATGIEDLPVWVFVHLEMHVHISLECKVQLYVTNDFNQTTDGRVSAKKGFVAVFVMKLPTINGFAVVSCCSACISKDLLKFFALSQNQHEEYSPSHLFSCRHSTAIAQHILAKNRQNCSVRNDLEAWELIANYLEIYEYNLKPGWIHTDRKESQGKLCVYIANDYVGYVFAVQRQQTGTLKCYCYICSKYQCHHSSVVTHTLEGEIPDTIRSIRIPPPPLNNLISKKHYPCI